MASLSEQRRDPVCEPCGRFPRGQVGRCAGRVPLVRLPRLEGGTAIHAQGVHTVVVWVTRERTEGTGNAGSLKGAALDVDIVGAYIAHSGHLLSPPPPTPPSTPLAPPQAGWGRIVNTGSMHALVASPYKSAYNAAKHGEVDHITVDDYTR